MTTPVEREKMRAALREKICVPVVVPPDHYPVMRLTWTDHECDVILDTVCKVLYEIAIDRKFVS